MVVTDKYYVYRPLLDLIGFTEGTDKRDGYNETLAYGKMLDGRITKGKGQRTVLVNMTRKEIDDLQTKMLRDPDNKKLKSSALGRYQEIRTTRRSIDKTLGRTGNELFDEAGQDEDACYLLGVRGIDKYLAGRMSEDTLINNLSKEWASLPKIGEGGSYAGQNAAVKVQRVREVLAAVRKRHAEGQPVKEVEVPKPVPVVPKQVDTEVKKKIDWWTKLTGGSGIGGLGLAGLFGADWQAIVAIGGTVLVALIILLLLRSKIVAAINDVRGVVEQ